MIARIYARPGDIHDRTDECEVRGCLPLVPLADFERLREELDKRAFRHGSTDAFKHIEYCEFCAYSREWIAEHGHGKDCLLRASDIKTLVQP